MKRRQSQPDIAKDLGLPAPKKPPTPNQVVRDVERTIEDPLGTPERIVKRFVRDTEKILP